MYFPPSKIRFSRTQRACLGALCVAMMYSSAWAQQTTLQLINEYPATSITADADLRFADLVKSSSGAQLLIEPLQEAKNPFKGGDQVEAVRTGKTQIGTLFGGVLGNVDSLFLLSSLPFAAKDFKQAKQLYSCAQSALETRAQALNARLLYVTPWPPSGIWSVAPLQSDADVKALKIRTYDATSKSVFERLGAQSVQLPYSALAPKLAAGEVNAVLTSGDGGAGRKLWDHLPNFTAVSYSIPLSYTLINKDTWNGLTEAQKSILTQAAQKVEADSWIDVEKRIDANYSNMRANRVALNTSPTQPILDILKKAGAEETQQWLKDNRMTGKDAQCLLQSS